MISRKSIFLKAMFLLAVWVLTAHSALAETLNYAHATFITSNGVEIPVEVADSGEKRSLGLGKRKALKEGWGMLFVFQQRKRHTFWMKDMNFPIDIIWLYNHKIVHVLHNVKPEKPGVRPPTLTPPEAANFVLEIEAGRSRQLNLKVGQRVRYRF